AEALKRKMDQIIDEADSMSERAASALERGFATGCPFLTDEPKDRGDEFKKKFQAESELTMWVQWAVNLDGPYWTKAQSGGVWAPYGNDERHAFDPIRRRLVILGVPLSVTRGTFGGQSGHPYDWAPPLDMVELIYWAKNFSRNKAAEEVCRPVQPFLLQIRRTPELACRVGE